MSDFETCARALFGSRARANVPLAPLTTFRVGGPADWLVETRTSEEILAALRLAHEHRVPVTLLGGGSNVLISDRGVRGVVIRPRGGEVSAPDDGHIRTDAAVTVNGLVRWTILRGLAGLEAWAGTPGTVGGAVFGNAHFGGRLIGELVTEVHLADREGRSQRVHAQAMGFGYDRSRLQYTGEVLLSATFAVSHGDVAALRAAARASLAFRRRTQPLEVASAGCVFQNPEPGRDHVPDNVPWSAGALVDLAGLKGRAQGGATVSNAHGNFIVNEGRATAEDIRALIEVCRTAVRRRFGVELRNEIVLLGECFDERSSPGNESSPATASH